MLREAEVGLAEGKRVAEMVRELGIPEQTYDRWCREYGGLKVSQARRLKELERENVPFLGAGRDHLSLGPTGDQDWPGIPARGVSPRVFGLWIARDFKSRPTPGTHR